jgi:hypothetical protein
MSSEFIKIQDPTRKYGEKNLLISQLSTINMHQGVKEFKKLRKEELTLKLSLKKRIDEANESLTRLLKLLPKTKLLEPAPEEPEEIPSRPEEKPLHITPEEKEAPTSLEKEISKIRKKLATL